MLTSTSIPAWLVELYNADKPEEALAALHQGWHQLGFHTALDQTSLILGFYYLRYLTGELSMTNLLLQAGGLIDGRNYKGPSCEAFYLLLNEYEGRPRALPYNQKTFAEKVESLFLKHANLAEKNLGVLHGAI